MSGGFVMFPEWLRVKKPSPNAVVAYITLGSFGTFNPRSGRYDECRPSMARMCEESGLSETSMKRAIAELVKLGGAIRHLRMNASGSSAPSSYELIFGSTVEPCPESHSLEGSTSGPLGGQERTQGGATSGPQPITSNQEPRTKTGIEASFDGSRLAQGKAAPALTRRSSRMFGDPKIQNEAADDAEATAIAANYLDDEDDDPAILVEYLRKNRNASTTAGHMRRLENDGPTGITEMYAAALVWADDLDSEHDRIRRVLVGAPWRLQPADASRLAQRMRDALAIGCANADVDKAVRAVGPTAGIAAQFAAVATVIERREAQRTEERIRRVRRQARAAA